MKTLKYGNHGAGVLKLQRLINDNDLYKPSPKLKEDGDYGTLTSGAVQGAKRACGYKAGNIDGAVAGTSLAGFLSGEKSLTAGMEKRRAARLSAATVVFGPAKVMRLAALAIVKGELGTLETPSNSNHIKYNDWWGWGAVAYCMIFVSWAWTKAGSKAFSKGSRWAGCREMLADAKAGNYGIRITHSPQPGTCGVIDLYGDARPDHAITYVQDNGDGTCQTIEGNTTKDGSYIQGVFNKTRKLSDCWWFAVEK